MYGIQTGLEQIDFIRQFENDVKMYGIQTDCGRCPLNKTFENDVKMYGIQTSDFLKDKYRPV